MTKKPAFQQFLILLFFNGFVFSHGYFYNFKLPIPFSIVMTLGLFSCLFPWMKSKANAASKAVLIVFSMVLMVVSVFISTFATMYVPGSRQHDYVMYEVCWPALEEHFAAKNLTQRPNLFNIHEVCEQNVWAGREPLYGIE